MLLSTLAVHPGTSVAAEPIAGRSPVPEFTRPVLQDAVTGLVVASRTGEPLAGAQVAVEGTTQGGLTNNRGRFQITGVTGTQVTLRVVMLGYRTVTQTVSVSDADIRIELEEAAVELDEIIVTGTTGRVQKRAIGNSVATVRASEIAQNAPVRHLGDVLNGRAPGVLVTPPEGQAGGGQRILIRGRSSLSLSLSPLIYVDGVRVDNRQALGTFSGQLASRLNDFSPEDIESIEIIKGPAAATLYGTEASNGVIQIITKKGQPGGAQVSMSIRQGIGYINDPVARWPTYFFPDPDLGTVVEFNVAENEAARGTPFWRTGHRQGYAVNVSGGSETVQYFTAVNYDRNQGSFESDSYERFGVRANVTAAPGDNWDLNSQLGVSLSRSEFPPWWIMGGSQLARPSVRDGPQRGWFRAPAEVFYRTNELRQDVDHLTAGFEVRHRPTAWLSHRMRAGIDVSVEDNVDLTQRMAPDDASFFSPLEAAGSKVFSQINVMNTTVDYSATGTTGFWDAFESATTGGFQYYRKTLTLLSTDGREFPSSGVTSTAGAATTFGSDDFIENVTIGMFVQQQLSWQNRIFLTAAVRGDDNSAFGQDFDFVTYPKFSASWVIGEEPWWNVSFVDALKLRAAWGKSGQQPDAFAALRTFQPITAQAGQPGVSPQFVGNSELEPEKSEEIEVGFEAALFDQRVGLDVTFYQQNTKDAILARNVSPSTGFPGQQFINAGELRNRGAEVLVTTGIIDTEDIAFELGVNFSYNDNEVLSLGVEGLDFLEFGFGTRFQPGFPAYSIFARRVMSADAGPDGMPINIMCDGGLPLDGEGDPFLPGGSPVDCLTAPRLFSGLVDPDWEGAVTPSLTLFRQLTVSALLDFKIGNRRWNSIYWCPGILDCEEEAHPERFDPVDVAPSALGFVDDLEWWHDVSFANLREVSVSYSLPGQWAERIGASRASVSVSGRNLRRWTPYVGIDPETEGLFPEAGAFGTPFDEEQVPQPRIFSTRINITF